ncbi:hypothetical protein K7X08_020725 [Anisodus acutangulus]|uniref:Riboflavin kinase n=1 Tax=Anisodus acutangulus TaxID=402998 RepID=A0A9Q1RMQ2_9SOLA|nr:hypothetical protein K7X08_020725 [Anisodus acutangulus]
MGDLHSANNHVQAHISAVIFYLDGTLLSTEHLTKRILKEFLAGYGKVPDKEKEKKITGLLVFTLSYCSYVWLQAKALPGANRLLKHLHKHGVPFALASTSKRKNMIFLEAAKQMGADAAHCLVIEDSVIGVKAGKAAGMKVVAVPSFHSEFDQYSIADSVLRSLLELKPELWGLPAFEDWVGNALLLQPVYFRGLYRNGLLHDFAYEFIKIVLGVGWEHGCCSSKRKIQTSIIDSSDEQIQDCKMEVVIVGYIRGSCDEGKSDKVEILEEDKSTANAALNLSEFSLGAFKSLFPEVALQDYCNLNGNEHGHYLH